MKDTYLWEREYRKDQRKPVNEKKKQYWDQLLGEALVAEFQKYDLNFKAYLEDQRFERKKGLTREACGWNIGNGANHLMKSAERLERRNCSLQNFTSLS